MLRRKAVDILLVDLHMSQVSGMEMLQRVKEMSPTTLVIVMTGHPTVESSIGALRAGAWDYLPKPFSATHLQILMGRASHTVLVGREGRRSRDDLDAQNGHSEKVTLLERCDAQLATWRTQLAPHVRAAATPELMLTTTNGMKADGLSVEGAVNLAPDPALGPNQRVRGLPQVSHAQCTTPVTKSAAQAPSHRPAIACGRSAARSSQSQPTR